MSISVSSAPILGAEADNRMLQRRNSMAADERAKKVSKVPYDENVGKLNKFYRQGNRPNPTSDCSWWESSEGSGSSLVQCCALYGNATHIANTQ